MSGSIFEKGRCTTKRRIPILLVAVVVCCVGVKVSRADCGTCDKTIVEVAAASEDFKTLDAAVKDGKVMINRANVVKTDIVCKNRVIHVLDAVILPPEGGRKKKK
jgi:uncharacterized surface protein with fasciclin (FAS1) repeats